MPKPVLKATTLKYNGKLTFQWRLVLRKIFYFAFSKNLTFTFQASQWYSDPPKLEIYQEDSLTSYDLVCIKFLYLLPYKIIFNCLFPVLTFSLLKCEQTSYSIQKIELNSAVCSSNYRKKRSVSGSRLNNYFQIFYVIFNNDKWKIFQLRNRVRRWGSKRRYKKGTGYYNSNNYQYNTGSYYKNSWNMTNKYYTTYSPYNSYTLLNISCSGTLHLYSNEPAKHIAFLKSCKRRSVSKFDS